MALRWQPGNRSRSSARRGLDQLDRIAVPVRILCGDLDVPHVQARCCQLAAALPDARQIGDARQDLKPSLENPTF